MTWTREKPTTTGFYWLYSDEWDKPFIVEIDMHHSRPNALVVWYHGNECESYTLPEGYWSAEPIEVPELPKETI